MPYPGWFGINSTGSDDDGDDDDEREFNNEGFETVPLHELVGLDDPAHPSRYLSHHSYSIVKVICGICNETVEIPFYRCTLVLETPESDMADLTYTCDCGATNIQHVSPRPTAILIAAGIKIEYQAITAEEIEDFVAKLENIPTVLPPHGM